MFFTGIGQCAPERWQPVTDLDSVQGIIVRLHQELEATKEVANEAKKFDEAQTNFDHEDFIQAIEILQKQLRNALESERLKND